MRGLRLPESVCFKGFSRAEFDVLWSGGESVGVKLASNYYIKHLADYYNRVRALTSATAFLLHCSHQYVARCVRSVKKNKLEQLHLELPNALQAELCKWSISQFAKLLQVVLEAPCWLLDDIEEQKSACVMA